ncbi:hypothetical protein [Aquimarina megaterium]|uniref:hypothetical protein n=1 Tax=Aquimarina megaterium TaxID=1443666 RepID=UPI00126913B6|nr:hypothetical protein [Aquimarina megaterium]
MKIKTVLTIFFLLILIPTLAQAQASKDQKSRKLIAVFRFNGITYEGDRVFGIHLNKEKIIEIALNELMRDNKHNFESDLKEMKICIDSIEKKKAKHFFKEFKKICPNGYQAISNEEYNNLTDIQKRGLLGNSSLKL